MKHVLQKRGTQVMYVSTWSKDKYVLQKGGKMGSAIGSEPRISCTYFSTWPLPGMFVAHTHSLDIQKYWIWSIHITTKASLFSDLDDPLACPPPPPSWITPSLHIHLCCRLLVTGPNFVTHLWLCPAPLPYLTSLITYLGSLSLVGGLVWAQAPPRNKLAR